MNGIIIVNKETDQTSRDVVNYLNDFFEISKIGHAGTLDPIATGVLIVCFGKATKLNEILTGKEKEYLTTMQLGFKTDSYDITGQVIDESDIKVNENQIIDALNHFKGEYEQEVPIYSAVKVNGKKLYEYARNNEEVVLPKKLINIINIELISIKDNLVTFKCLVSKGTYIRSLINDLGNYLGTFATMTELSRTKQGDFEIAQAVTLKQITNNEYKLITIEEIFKDYPKEIVDNEKLRSILNGAVIDKDFKEDYIVYYDNDQAIAIYYEYLKDSTKAKPYLML